MVELIERILTPEKLWLFNRLVFNQASLEQVGQGFDILFTLTRSNWSGLGIHSIQCSPMRRYGKRAHEVCQDLLKTVIYI